MAKMSNSYRKPYITIHSTSGQKQFRTQENKAKRRATTIILSLFKNNCTEFNEDIEIILERRLPQEKEYGNEWLSPRDGKPYYIGSYRYSLDPWEQKWYKEAISK